MGQEVEAVVVLAERENLDEATVQALVGRVLADFKIPKRIHFVEGTIPKGPTGKIQRKNLTELLDKKSAAAACKSVKPEIGAIVKALLADLLHITPSAVTDTSTLFELGADSIIFIRLVSALRARGITVTTRDLFANPSVNELVRIIQYQKEEEPDPQPFELLGPGCVNAAADVAAQLGVPSEDVEDVFSLIRGQALMYRAAMITHNTPTWFVGDMVKLSEKVDVERWIKVWNTVFENESCRCGTLVGRVKGQDPAHSEPVNTAYLSPRALAPHWVHLRADSRFAARGAVEAYVSGLRHAVGMPIHFVLAAYHTGTIFANSARRLVAIGRRLVSLLDSSQFSGAPLGC
ncbi:hypothetical protein B0H14DRAFT_878129 [Mycena olivaceomarginata]|nr:hypothetical protein B0H14DRAFT_878129 [Mycena olivaceomarginata]